MTYILLPFVCRGLGLLLGIYYGAPLGLCSCGMLIGILESLFFQRRRIFKKNITLLCVLCGFVCGSIVGGTVGYKIASYICRLFGA